MAPGSTPAIQRKRPVRTGPEAEAVQRQGGGDESDSEEDLYASGDTIRKREQKQEEDDAAQVDRLEAPFRARLKNFSKEVVDAAWKRARVLILEKRFNMNTSPEALAKQEQARLRIMGNADRIEAPFREQFSKENPQVLDVAVELAKRQVMSTGKLFDPSTQGQALIDQARHQLKVGIGVAMLQNKLEWTKIFGGQAETEFGQWLLAGGPPPTNASSMNCYEAVLFGAFKVGAATFQGLQQIYQRIAGSNDSIENHIKGGPVGGYFPGRPGWPRPTKGDIVVFGTAENHTTLAVGNKDDDVEVLSLYNRPGRDLFLKKTTVEALQEAGTTGDVRYFSPRFQ